MGYREESERRESKDESQERTEDNLRTRSRVYRFDLHCLIPKVFLGLDSLAFGELSKKYVSKAEVLYLENYTTKKMTKKTRVRGKCL